MSFQTIEFTKEAGIAMIRFNTPDKMNALSPEMKADLFAAFDDLDADETARVLILIGSGKAFSAGGDLSKFKFDNAAAARRFSKATSVGIHRRLEMLEIPVIAAVNGFAFGGGMELCLFADLVIASENAKFALPEASLGAVAGLALVRGPEVLGRRKLKELMWLGDRIDAQEAYRIGLVNKVVPHEQLEAAAREMADKIAKKAPLAVRLSKNALNRNLNEGDWVVSTEVGALLLGSEDLREGVNSFFEKRSPVFKGR